MDKLSRLQKAQKTCRAYIKWRSTTNGKSNYRTNYCGASCPIEMWAKREGVDLTGDITEQRLREI